ncbi:hypothetical protein JOC85_001800 [Bacillus mesophilus]|nr:hypothetical protein [Bacillus mesophilus]
MDTKLLFFKKYEGNVKLIDYVDWALNYVRE